MKYQLREMVKEDIEKIVQGEEKVFGHSLGYDLIYSDFELNPYACYIVLEIDNEVHGYIGMWINENVEIINLYVDEEYQGMGFGSMLMDFVIDVCESSKVFNLSSPDNTTDGKRSKTSYTKRAFFHRGTIFLV